MGRERVAAAAGIVIALLAGAGLPGVSSGSVQFQAADSPTNPGGWDAVLNYEINANWTNVTDYWVDGTFSDVITCTVDWAVETDTTTSTTRDNQRQYALDYEEAEFGFIQAKNGTLSKKVVSCASPILESTSDSSAHWDEEEDTEFGPDNDEDSDGTGPFLPLSPGAEKSATKNVDEQEGHVLTVFGADTTTSTGLVPLTGTARADLVITNSQDVMNRVSITSVGGYVVDRTTEHGVDNDGEGEPKKCGTSYCTLEIQDGTFIEGSSGAQQIIPSSGHMKARVRT